MTDDMSTVQLEGFHWKHANGLIWSIMTTNFRIYMDLFQNHPLILGAKWKSQKLQDHCPFFGCVDFVFGRD